jgi:hypothetical protein
MNGSNSTLTLGGSNYSLCKLTLNQNSSIFIATGASVRIYFDSPEECGYDDPSELTQFLLEQNTRITTTGAGDVAFLFVGSDDLLSQIHLKSNTQASSCEQDFVIYAPLSHILMDSNSTFCGGLASQSIEMRSNAHVFTNDLVDDFELPNTFAAHYQAEEFIECNVTGGPTPDTGC